MSSHFPRSVAPASPQHQHPPTNTDTQPLQTPTSDPQYVRVSRRFLESQLHWTFAHHPTLDENTITLPMPTLHQIISGHAHIQPTPADDETSLNAPSVSARLRICARQIESDFELKKAVDELVETYNGANPGRKRKFEELLYREEEIRERARAERAARSASGAAGGVARRRLVGVRQSKFGQPQTPEADHTHDTNATTSSPTDPDPEIAALEAKLTLLKRQKLSNDTAPAPQTYRSEICSAGCGAHKSIKHPHILGQEWTLQRGDPICTDAVGHGQTFYLNDLTFPTISKYYKECVSTTDKATALGLLDLLAQAAENPVVCGWLMYCQAQEVSSVMDAYRMSIVFANRWVSEGQEMVKPFFQGGVGAFSQRWRIMEVMAARIFTVPKAIEAVEAFYRDLPAVLVEKHAGELEVQKAGVKAIVGRRGGNMV